MNSETNFYMESSLTAPEDRTSTREKPWRPSRAPPLSLDEADKAFEVLNDNSYIGLNFPRVDRVYADPAIVNQVYGLFSFVPAKGAKPNENGVFGYAKLRGNYGTDIEASQKAEDIIRNVDSYHTLYHCFVGRPFPLTSSSKYTKEVNEIDIRKQMTESVSSEIKQKKATEKRAMEEIQEREAALLEENRKIQAGEDIEDVFDTYITLKVKKAQLTYTYTEHQKKMEEIRHILVTTKKNIEDLDATNPEFNERYFEKYRKARLSAGLEDVNKSEENFIKFMVEDVSLPEVDELYKEKYGEKIAIEETAINEVDNFNGAEETKN